MSAPAYLLGRIGILMLGSEVLFILGVLVLALGFALQAGATGAVKAVKMSAQLIAGGAGAGGIAVRNAPQPGPVP